MSIFNLTQIATHLSTYSNTEVSSPSPLQLAAAAITMIIAIPTLIKLAITPATPPPKKPSPIHKWVIDNREIDFIKTKDQSLKIRVTNKTDNTVIERSMGLDTFLSTIPSSLRILTMINDCQPYGWDKDGAPKIIKIKPEVLHTWILDNETITLTSFNQKLRWKSSRESSTHWSPPLPANQKDQLLAQQPLKWNEKTSSPDLTVTTKNPPRWKFENKDISLVERNGELTWELNNSLLKTTSWYPINPTHFSHLSKKDRIQRLQFQKLEIDSIIHDTVIQKLSFRVSFSALSAFQYIEYTQDLWAVTLLNDGECDYNETSTWGGHAKILLEGIEYACPFAITLDFVPNTAKKGFGRVNVIELPPRAPVNHVGKSDTRAVPYQKALTMLNAAYLERDQNQTKPLPFNKHGIDSYLSRRPAHNCTTWALQKLSLAGIQFPPDWLAKFYAMPRRFTIPKP